MSNIIDFKSLQDQRPYWVAGHEKAGYIPIANEWYSLRSFFTDKTFQETFSLIQNIARKNKFGSIAQWHHFDDGGTSFYILWDPSKSPSVINYGIYKVDNVYLDKRVQSSPENENVEEEPIDWNLIDNSFNAIKETYMKDPKTNPLDLYTELCNSNLESFNKPTADWLYFKVEQYARLESIKQ